MQMYKNSVEPSTPLQEGNGKEVEKTTEADRLERAENEKWMRRCLQLARCGRMGAAPNPMVGAVIVYRGRIIGEGYHIRCGEAHAEVRAIGSVRPADRDFLKDSTIYVSLEPCAHYGRTPPCAELIVRTGIPRVVVGCVDPFARVSGRGIDILRKAGVEVTVGVLEEECLELNRRFITAQTKGRPYITLKWAVSADGFLDAWREGPFDEAEKPTQAAQLSTSYSLVAVHHLRATNQAILVGHNTLRLDRPSLTVRHWSGNDPLRVVLGTVGESELPSGFVAYADINTMLDALHEQGIQSLLVEGGAQTIQSFIDRGLWDEAREELSTRLLGCGVPVPKMPVGVVRRSEQTFGVTVNHWKNFEGTL